MIFAKQLVRKTTLGTIVSMATSLNRVNLINYECSIFQYVFVIAFIESLPNYEGFETFGRLLLLL